MLVPLEKPESNIRFAQEMDNEKLKKLKNERLQYHVDYNLGEIEKHAMRISGELKRFLGDMKGARTCSANYEWGRMMQVLKDADKALKEIEFFGTALRKGNGQWLKDFDNFLDKWAPK